jgi:hypothetical protein
MPTTLLYNSYHIKGSTVISQRYKNKHKMVQTPNLPMMMMMMKQYLTSTLTTGYSWPLHLQTYIPKYQGNTKVKPKDMHTMPALLTPCAWWSESLSPCWYT